MNAGQGREFRLSHLPCDLILAQKVPTLHLAPTDSVGGCGLVNSRQWFKFSFSSRCPLPSPQWGGNGYELLIIIGWVLNSELPMFSPVNTGGRRPCSCPVCVEDPALHPAFGGAACVVGEGMPRFSSGLC